MENPEIEATVSSLKYEWIRLHGKAVFEDRMDIKEICIKDAIVKSQYTPPDNPIFYVFHVENSHA